MNALTVVGQRRVASGDALAHALALAAGGMPGGLAAAAVAADVPVDELLSLAAAKLGMPLLHAPELMDLPPEFGALGPAEASSRCCVLVRHEGRLTAVHADPFDPILRGWLESRVTEVPRYALADATDIAAYLNRHEHSLRAMDAAVGGAGAEESSLQIEALSLASISRDDNPVVKLVNSTLFDALRAGASDIHIETAPGQLVVRYREDGVLVHVASVPGTAVADQVISRIKVMSELDIAERRVPQDGRFKVSIEDRQIDFRVSIMPSAHGEDAVLRILDRKALADEMQGLSLDGLGFGKRIVEGVRRLSRLPYGMLLVTGPTGSGKTTTLYAALTETNTGRDKIITIEDPVEYQLPGVLQIPVNEKKGLTFARGLRSVLRHDPDKIMVGEIRDTETAQIAIQSALTGHLVFTTVHANNSFDVVSRFVHMGVDPHGLVGAMSGILAQRLIRVICPHCAVRDDKDLPGLRAAGVTEDYLARATLRQGKGCGQCRGQGYRGRRALGELLVMDDALREAIVDRAPVRNLKALARANGMRTLREAALALVLAGGTTLEEADRVTALA